MDAIEPFEVLVRENGGMLSAFLMASVPASAVDDLWQETMLTAWRRWEDYDRTRPFGAWIRGIASKNVLAWYRKHSRDAAVLDPKDLDVADREFERLQKLPGDTFDEKLSALRECIGKLPENYRDTVLLRYEKGLRPAELAATISRNAETVKKRLHRAKTMLLHCIRRKLSTELSGA